MATDAVSISNDGIVERLDSVSEGGDEHTTREEIETDTSSSLFSHTIVQVVKSSSRVDERTILEEHN